MTTVEREHYAHGATLFVWKVTGVPDLYYEDYPTKKAAIQAVETVLGPMVWTRVFATEFDGSTMTTAQYRGESA